MYNTSLLREAMIRLGLNYYRLGLAARVDSKTAKSVVETGGSNPDKIYAVAKALGFDVKKGTKQRYDFTAILKPKNGNGTAGK
jgi:hypothetical protein